MIHVFNTGLSFPSSPEGESTDVVIERVIERYGLVSTLLN